MRESPLGQPYLPVRSGLVYRCRKWMSCCSNGCDGGAGYHWGEPGAL